MDYIRYLGVEVVWINPMYQSPMLDFGYDVSNHTQVDPLYGTMEDLDLLIKTLHSAGKCPYILFSFFFFIKRCSVIY